MRIDFIVPAAALALVAALPAPARAQLYVTSITASFPDPNNKVPAFNVVPGAGIQTWSIGLAQAVLVHGQAYNYCASLGSGPVGGKASVAYKITRGSTVIQSATIITAKQFPVVANGIWYFCAGFHALPNNPGAATLIGSAAFTASTGGKAKVSKISVPILLQ